MIRQLRVALEPAAHYCAAHFEGKLICTSNPKRIFRVRTVKVPERSGSTDLRSWLRKYRCHVLINVWGSRGGGLCVEASLVRVIDRDGQTSAVYLGPFTGLRRRNVQSATKKRRAPARVVLQGVAKLVSGNGKMGGWLRSMTPSGWRIPRLPNAA